MIVFPSLSAGETAPARCNAPAYHRGKVPLSSFFYLQYHSGGFTAGIAPADNHFLIPVCAAK